MTRALAACILMALALIGPVAASPVIGNPASADGAREITAAGYTARMSAAGQLVSLKIGPAEFIASGKDSESGSHLTQISGQQKGEILFDSVSQPSAAAIEAVSKSAGLKYDFSDDSIRVTITNRSDGWMIYYHLRAPEVHFASNDAGKLVMLSDTQDWKNINWFRDNAKLRTIGCGGMHGFYAGGKEVETTGIQPGGVITVTYIAGTASDTEIAAIKAAQPADPLARPQFDVFCPSPYQVFQRQSKDQGFIRVSGRTDGAGDHVDVRITGSSPKGALAGQWRRVPSDPSGYGFFDDVSTPAGGWYMLEVRDTHADKSARVIKIPDVGVGEVFVGAGQSNSTNFGQTKTTPKSGMVSAFNGASWSLAADPMPGANDKSGGGSFWPTFGDAMYDRFHVPIGIAVTGQGGTSVGSWHPGSDLYDYMMARVMRFGPHGFRALLWHQGEADVAMESNIYATLLANVIRGSQEQAGWEIPWFVAQVSYWSPTEPSAKPVRLAQKKLWDLGIAHEGPDTDTLTGDNRYGAHMTAKGLVAHGKMWAKIVGDFVQEVMDQK